jgi:hypothetical protein
MSLTRAGTGGNGRSRPLALLDGKVFLPEHGAFERARRAWNLAVDQQPAVVVAAESEEDVVAAVTVAHERGLRVAAQGTGHGAAPLGPLEDTLLLKTDRMRGIEVDPGGRIVRVEAGVTWLEAVEAAARHGLALLAGSAPDAGVVGYTLGGGLSWLSRKHGLACNSVEAVELVLADGRAVRADREHEPDLFWAVRGGGGSFGVVTALELRALPITDLYAGSLWWPIERGDEVLHCWRELAERGLPDELTTSARYVRLPNLPEIPEPLRARPFVVVEAYHLGVPAAADELLAPLRALNPENDTLDTIPIGTLSQASLDPAHPVPIVGDGMLLAELPSEAIDQLVQSAGAGIDSALLSIEIRQLGGELSRARPGHGALASIDARYAIFAVGVAHTAELGRAVRSDLERLQAAVAPWTSPRMFLNFAETPRRPAALWSEHGHRRLCQIKRRIDPNDMIRSNHPVAPA